jgi:Flp pilus assembly protein TadG
MRAFFQSLIGSTDGAVAPTVALSLFGLLAVGGIAFDYSRMASLDTELQSAADQAALAAATQLDGGANARNRATAAANDLLRNVTVFADAQGASNGDPDRIAVPTVNFYQSYNEATDTPGAAATNDANAKVVIVSVGTRRASFAFTPIVGALNSGMIGAEAVATLSSAVCKVPPLMICAPGTDYPQPADLGKGLLLKPGGGGAWVPGDYGYLDFGNGASGVSTNLGVNNDASVCRDNDDGIPTEPGNKASVTKALNTRFDLYAASVPACNATTGDYCPAQNTTKDLGFTEDVDVKVKKTDPIPGNPGCGDAAAVRRKGDNKVDDDFIQGNPPKGFPRDTCHINGTCTTNFGNGTWDRDAFVADANPAMTASAIATAMGKVLATLTRWDVYQWQLQDRANRLANRGHDITPSPIPYKDQGANRTYTFTNRCSRPQPFHGTGVAAGANQKDRRLLTVAVVDCSGQNGKFDAKVLRFADVFLVEPSIDRTTPYATGKDEIYVEVVRVAERAGGQSAFQYYLRQRPRLIK